MQENSIYKRIRGLITTACKRTSWNFKERTNLADVARVLPDALASQGAPPDEECQKGREYDREAQRKQIKEALHHDDLEPLLLVVSAQAVLK